MKKLLIAAAAVALFAGVAEARETETYVSLKGAWVSPHNSVKIKETADKIKTTEHMPAVRAALGVAMPIPTGVIRSELELGYNSSSVEKISLDPYAKLSTKSYSALANVYYDMCTTTAFRPYIGAGIGYSYLKARTVGESDTGSYKGRLSGSSLAWQAGAGVGYKITKGWYADLGYRWADYGSKTHEGVRIEAKGHEISFGFRYQF